MRTVLPAAVTMIAYAIAVLFIGYLTWSIAPPGANALTALLVSIGAAAGMTICAVLTLRVGASRTQAMLGLYLGVALPVLVALGPAFRLRSSLDKSSEFNEAVRRGPVVVVPLTNENKGNPHPTAYQTVGLGAVSALSILTFVVLVVHLPRLPRAHSEGAPAAAHSGTAPGVPPPEPPVIEPPPASASV